MDNSQIIHRESYFPFEGNDLAFNVVYFVFVLFLHPRLFFLALGEILRIDVCQSDGNLLALGGASGDIKIFDKRELKIVQTFPNIHKGNI